MTLENLIGKGLQREPTSAEEIRRFLVKISLPLFHGMTEPAKTLERAKNQAQESKQSVGYEL